MAPHTMAKTGTSGKRSVTAHGFEWEGPGDGRPAPPHLRSACREPSSKRAQETAEDALRRVGCDREVDRVRARGPSAQVHHQPEQVEVQRPERQVENGADGSRLLRSRCCEL